LKTVIIANGELDSADLRQIAEADQLIAADGGFAHCIEHGLTPSVVIGDLDSLEEGALADFAGQVIRHPADKDESDLELALAYSIEQGAKEILILAGLGIRWGQTIANVMLLSTVSTQVRLVDGLQELFVLKAGEVAKFDAPVGSTVSLIPLSDDVQGVKTRGLRYPLKDESLQFGKTRGLSNSVIAEPATVEISRGRLLCVIIRNGSDTDED
jgi:thiamine pyrophosphokinase